MVDVAASRGHDAKLFDTVRQPDSGYVFMHMHSHPAVRNNHKRMMQHFATNPALWLIPSYRVSVMHDDKLEQQRQLARYLPPTHLFRSPTMARDYIETMPTLPLISKSSEGSGTRMLRTHDDLRREVKLAFSDLGVKNRYGDRHHGYVYWQDYVGDQDNVTRVLVIGQQRLVLRRGKRVNGLREHTPVIELDANGAAACVYVNELASDHAIKFAAFDVIQVGKTWNLLKITVNWSVRRYNECRFFPDNRLGTAIWDVLMDEIDKGNLD